MQLGAAEQLSRVASLLASVADGRLGAAEALLQMEQWHDVPWRERPFAAAYHALRHFDIDVDIRTTDADYARDQVEALRRLALAMREEAQGT